MSFCTKAAAVIRLRKEASWTGAAVDLDRSRRVGPASRPPACVLRVAEHAT